MRSTPSSSLGYASGGSKNVTVRASASSRAQTRLNRFGALSDQWVRPYGGEQDVD
jgi:hypothetical protein